MKAADEKTEQETLKEKGNEQFQKGQFEAAVKYWTSALELPATDAKLTSILYSNRAAAWLALKQYTQALGDCDRAIELQPGFERPYVRKCEILRAVQESKQDVPVKMINKQRRDLLTLLAMESKVPARAYALLAMDTAIAAIQAHTFTGHVADIDQVLGDFYQGLISR
jgi:tetratricopeptide (TPR) repeat protein